jgi:GntR family transcriptional regulator/MocR family aminotransferase
MTTSHADLPVVVDRAGAVPLAGQISAQVRAAVAGGVLRTGDRLPSTRDLAATLSVSRTVVTTAYVQLFAEGWLEGRHGSGTYVADVAPAVGTVPAPAVGPVPAPAVGPVPHRAAGPVPAPSVSDPNCAIEDAPATSIAQSRTLGGRAEPGGLIELRAGIPWAAGIEPAVWRRAWRYAGTRPPSPWPDPHGLPELRAELAAYLRRSRGLAVSPAQVLVTRGVAGGLTLLAAALLRPGDTVGVEEPGYPAAREVLSRAGARVVPCRVDAHGVVPDELPGGLRLLYTTPAHQYPLGGRLPVGRRQALTAWARRCGAIVVEDDYDSEFRYDVGPLPALHSMDPDVIVYLGTASKVLAPAFGAGWLVAAPDLVERLAELRPDLGERVSEPVQHALLALLTSGDLERHIRRMRLEYARRRAALVCGLPEAGTFRLLGDTAGMHLVVEFPAGSPAGRPAERVVAAAAARGVALSTLDRYFAGPSTLSGLILGYGAATLTQVRRAATILDPLLASLPLRGDRQRGGGQRGEQFHRRDLEHVRTGEPVDFDRARADVLAAGNLRRPEVTAARPEHGAAFGAPGQAPGRTAGRPAARHAPRVKPVNDRAEAGQRTAGERLGRMPEHADLHAYPAFGVHVLRGSRHAVRIPVELFRRAERAAGPQDGDELDDVARHRIPDEMAGAAFAD